MLVREGARSGSYISIMDDANDMLIGMSDMDVLGAVSPEHIRRMAEKDKCLRHLRDGRKP